MKNFVVTLALSLASFSIHISEAPPAVQPYYLEEIIVSGLAQKFHRPIREMREIVSIAHEISDDSFPTALDILAVIGVESSFNPSVSHAVGPSVGLMQINTGVHKIENPKNIKENMTKGVAILREYRRGGRHDSYALLAYNTGPYKAKKICALKEVKCISKYVNKVSQLKKELVKLTQTSLV